MEWVLESSLAVEDMGSMGDGEESELVRGADVGITTGLEITVM